MFLKIYTENIENGYVNASKMSEFCLKKVRLEDDIDAYYVKGFIVEGEDYTDYQLTPYIEKEKASDRLIEIIEMLNG